MPDIEQLAALAGMRYTDVDTPLDSSTAWQLLQQAFGLPVVRPIGESPNPSVPTAPTSGAPGVNQDLKAWQQAYQRQKDRLAQLENELKQAAERERRLREQLSERRPLRPAIPSPPSVEPRRRIEELSKRNAELGRRTVELKRQLSEANAEIARQSSGRAERNDPADAAREIQSLRARIDRLDDANRRLRLAQQPVQDAMRSLRSEIKLSQKNLGRVSAEAKRLRADSEHLRRSLDKQAGRNKDLYAALKEQKAANRQLEQRLRSLTDHRSETLTPAGSAGARQARVARKGAIPDDSSAASHDDPLPPAHAAWIRSLRGRREDVFHHRTIVLLGKGPHTSQTLRRKLRSSDCKIVPTGSEEASVLIVGRDDWFADDIEDQIKLRAGQELRIYSQEMAALAIQHGHDPLNTATRSMLKAFAKDHPALTFCIEEGFKWPLIDTARIASELARAWDEGVGESPLHKMGYHVGKTGVLIERRRRKILREALEDDLPFVDCKQYMKRWGTPESRRRLRRMATHLRWNIGSARARKVDMKVAIAHWSDDLDWMRDHLYEDWMRFRWPSTSVSL